MQKSDEVGVLQLPPKAEPFKRWLAQVGYERIQEIEDPELIFPLLGEAATKEIAVRRDARGFDENKSAAKIAGDARHQLEQYSGTPVISRENYLGRLIPVPDEQRLLESDEEVK